MYTRDLRLLSYFVTVVDAGSLTAAARKLNVSTPVVSQALSDLEESVGHSLLTRGRGKFALTSSGAKVYIPAAKMVQSAADAMDALDVPAEKISGFVSVTMSTEISVSWFPEIYLGFRTEFPEVAVKVDARDEVVSLAKSNNDAALRASYSLRPNERATENDLLDLPLALVISPSFEFAPGSNLRTRLKQVPFIQFSQNRSHGQGEAKVSAINRKTRRRETLPVNTLFQVNNGIIARDLACRGLGAALVIEQSVLTELSSGELIRVSEQHDFGYVSISAVFRDRYPSLPAQKFIEYCRKVTSDQ